jgi:glucose-6-phosphate isomerase
MAAVQGRHRQLRSQKAQTVANRRTFDNLVDLRRAPTVIWEIAPKSANLPRRAPLRPDHAMALAFADQFQANLAKLAELKAVDRLWQRDGTLFSADIEVARSVRNRLGWMYSAQVMRDQVERLAVLAKVVERQRYDRVLVLGMGGSSLWPEVVGRHLQGQRGLPVRIADSTHPAAVSELIEWGRQGKPLFVVATKSGSTVETSSLYKVLRPLWNDGQHFVAITDPGSGLETLAKAEGFRDIFLNPPDIGGRFSASSLFGLVPAVLAGVVLHDALGRIEEMLEACREPDPALNPGAALGAWLAAAEQCGRWQMRLTLGKDVRGFGGWIEQLVAESTGKHGRGVLPVVGGVEGEGPALAAKMEHAVVVGLSTFAHPDDSFLARAQTAGVPDQAFVMPEAGDLWGEVIRWAYATAICGLLLEINPFDEPDVSSAKAATNALLSGQAQPVEPDQRLEVASVGALVQALQPRLDTLSKDDYLAVLAYLPPNQANTQRLEALRTSLQAKTAAAVVVQFGPRYLHSTGQFHKGGLARGLFVLLTDLDQPGLPDHAIAGAPYTFAQLAKAQAQGDVWVLKQRGKPVVVADLIANAVAPRD